MRIIELKIKKSTKKYPQKGGIEKFGGRIS